MAIANEYMMTLDGFAVSRNMPPLGELPLGRFCAFVWWFFTKDSEQKEIDKFRSRLWIPPVGEVAQGPWSADAESKAFSAFSSSVKGR